MNYKKSYTFEHRLKKSTDIMLKYPKLIPVIIEKYNDNIDDNIKNKYIISKDAKFGILANLIRESLVLDRSKALFFYTNNKLININDLISVLYDKYKDADGFLYIEYALENTFGMN